MTRFRLLLVIVLATFVFAVSPAFAQEEMPGEGPAVVLEEDAEAIDEQAWTFRFLVPTLILGTALAVVGVVVGYGVRVRGRYRVTQ